MSTALACRVRALTQISVQARRLSLTTPNGTASKDAVSETLLRTLVCPLSKQPLRYDRVANELVSEPASLAFPVLEGIPRLILQDARQLSETELADILKRVAAADASLRQ